MKTYRHKESGNYYTVITDKFMVKDNVPYPVYERESDSQYIKTEYKLQWKKNMVLYRAEYNNPDGQLFGRNAEDFFKNFVEVKFKNIETNHYVTLAFNGNSYMSFDTETKTVNTYKTIESFFLDNREIEV